ncbi:YHS domain-containing (seleno)protein [Ruegeria arenilitoris]|uniref:YHS domain-containing (seleno)protein n=1 Tax=Ruegeria arenilitoris TaxID=1173585 RepID=UPI00147A14B4|nr:YHS domain-containing (seleno)protein [Ruegeria arenilitoris]
MFCSIITPMVRAKTLPMFFAGNGYAVSGYDAVSYFRTSGPVIGQKRFSLMWKGAEWRFDSLVNRDRFERNPRAFAPQYGGYCAYAMAKGELLSSDPKAWKIINGRLYLTHSAKVEKVWAKNVGRYIRQADQHWPAVLYQG